MTSGYDPRSLACAAARARPPPLAPRPLVTNSALRHDAPAEKPLAFRVSIGHIARFCTASHIRFPEVSPGFRKAETMPKQSDPQQRPMFDAFEMVRLEGPAAPSPTGPKPDSRQLTLTGKTCCIAEGNGARNCKLPRGHDGSHYFTSQDGTP